MRLSGGGDDGGGGDGAQVVAPRDDLGADLGPVPGVSHSDGHHQRCVPAGVQSPLTACRGARARLGH